MRIPIFITFALCAANALGSAAAASHYVDLSGDDTNSGLEGSPWRTLARAFYMVEADKGHTIHIGEGTFTETGILKLKSGVNLIGAGSGKTKILVNHPFSLTDAVPGANPHVHTFPEHFVLQVGGANQVRKRETSGRTPADTHSSRRIADTRFPKRTSSRDSKSMTTP